MNCMLLMKVPKGRLTVRCLCPINLDLDTNHRSPLSIALRMASTNGYKYPKSEQHWHISQYSRHNCFHSTTCYYTASFANTPAHYQLHLISWRRNNTSAQRSIRCAQYEPTSSERRHPTHVWLSLSRQSLGMIKRFIIACWHCCCRRLSHDFIFFQSITVSVNERQSTIGVTTRTSLATDLSSSRQHATNSCCYLQN